jgi:PAS domain S-box-containing protein
MSESRSPSPVSAEDHAERRYQRLAEQLPGVVYTEALQAASAMYISPRIEHLTGYTAAEWTADDTFFERVLHPDDRVRVGTTFAEARERREAVVCEYRIIRPDGSLVWVNDDAGIAYDDDGAALYIQGYMADVTARKDTEEKLEEARLAVDAEHAQVLELERAQNERLRELDVMKDEFVALVSHELRTPLTAVQGYTELVLDGTAGELNDEQRSMLMAVDRSSARLFRLINDLLFVAQVNAGTLTVALEDVDLASVAREAIDDARPRAAAADVSLEFESALTPTVKADRVRLGQVFDNLISNAIKFTPPGGRVRLTISMVGEEAIVVVTDSGMGMTAEDQQRLFTRFFRTKAAAKIQGTGLGLSITKAIVDAHHGSISVESEVGTGTSFTFTVPTTDLSGA